MSLLLPTRNTTSSVPTTALGQGKRACTIMADQGDMVYVISDVPKTVRSRRHHTAYYKGARPMHSTTLRIPTQNYSTYGTTSNHFHGGRLDLSTPEQRRPYGSQQMSQVVFGADENNKWLTKYTWEYPGRDPPPPRVLHYPEQLNKLNMNEGCGMKKSLHTTDKQGAGTTFTQYNRVHNKLGAALGPGVPRDFPIREKYNPITGETGGAAWSAQNRRISGNRVLHASRREESQNFLPC